MNWLTIKPIHSSFQFDDSYPRRFEHGQTLEITMVLWASFSLLAE
jgi:hypothetical protein